MARGLTELFTSPSGLRDLLRHIGLFVSAIGTILSMIFGSASGADPIDPVNPEQSYESPSPEEQAQLEEIRTELNTAILELRYNTPVNPVVMDVFELQSQAQKWAERTAVLGKEEATKDNVAMIQHNLPVGEASAYNFVDAWIRSEPHLNVLIDPDHTFYGIGVAQAHGRVWVTIQFSR
ncbi:hypothetical protein CATRI_10695 [Corynebacterium atrinae]|uniref:CAP domain-containing protein n=1 Tax=Corynebacterium atrinae TaxID=1336740 RepID=UPI0025B37C14|nr:CAP domain-containing protein [Corynebacterium atrinae]WJY64199.1 hypothetical protein CATRI_10695 [Corynebacterium atrinae]